jgi:hypothetical protein
LNTEECAMPLFRMHRILKEWAEPDEYRTGNKKQGMMTGPHFNIHHSLFLVYYFPWPFYY